MLEFALYKNRKSYIQMFSDKRNLSDSPSGSVSKESTCNGGDPGLIPGSGRSLGEANGYPTRVFLPRKSHGQRSLAGYGPLGHKSQTQLSNYSQIK